MTAANDLDYILGAGTYGSDTTTNACGVVAGHAYSLISTFELKFGTTVVAEVYMIRNPWGATMHSGGRWSDSTCGNTDGSATDAYGDACSAYNSGNAIHGVDIMTILTLSQTLCAAHVVVEKLSLHLGQITISLKFLTASMLQLQQTMVFSSLTKLSSWAALMTSKSVITETMKVTQITGSILNPTDLGVQIATQSLCQLKAVISISLLRHTTME